jgi:hypothetical protein
MKDWGGNQNKIYMTGSSLANHENINPLPLNEGGEG